ncbi:MAG: dihydroxyacetone kinase subunit DhaL [Propionibacteriaceae bacterium]|nr:dihydroxyacetone kinase subunit DhaL [Propionibacteriaceae bacterium]
MIHTSQCVAWLKGFAQLVHENKAYLTELDSAIGDADHGVNMDRGLATVIGELDDQAPLSALFKSAGMTLVSSVGGAAGPLYGTFFMRLGATLGATEEVSALDFGAGLRAGIDGVAARGKATVGEKTMLDALTPAVDAFEQAAGDGVGLAAVAAHRAAAAGRDATIPLVATKGRASYLGERSAGHQDPGATSAALLFQALVAATGEG